MENICQCDQHCLLHGIDKQPDYQKKLIEKASIMDNNWEVKHLLCRIINDVALYKVMEKYQISVFEIKEMKNPIYDYFFGCNIGLHAQKTRTITLRRDGNKIYEGKAILHDHKNEIKVVLRIRKHILKYVEVVAILLHELTHFHVLSHDQGFIDFFMNMVNSYYFFAKKYNILTADELENIKGIKAQIEVNVPTINNYIKRVLIFLIILLCGIIFVLCYFRYDSPGRIMQEYKGQR